MNDLPGWQEARLAELLDAFDGMALTETDLRILTWLSGWEASTTATIANLVRRARLAGTEPAEDPWIALPGGGVRFLPGADAGQEG